jgi:uncharacterized membrane protein YeaQ/YmgE (transglycosylase-associated protein family)
VALPYARLVSILAWIIVGLIAGLVGTSITGTKRRGCLFTIAVGVIGAVIGGALFSAAGARGISTFDWWTLLVATIGAVLFLLVLGAIERR